MAPRKTPKVTRNPDLVRGVEKYSGSKMYHKRGLWATKAKNGGVFPKHNPKPKSAATVEKLPKLYPIGDIKKPLPNKRKPKPTKLRRSSKKETNVKFATLLLSLKQGKKGKSRDAPPKNYSINGSQENLFFGDSEHIFLCWHFWLLGFMHYPKLILNLILLLINLGRRRSTATI